MDTPKWHEIYEAMLGKTLSQREVDVWDFEIQNKISDCTSSEIVEAVRSLAEDKRKGILKYQITASNLISRVIKGRYQDRTGTDDAQLNTSHDEQMNHWKSDIRLAPDMLAKWEIICEPSKVHDCAELEKFAENLPGGFRRPIFPKLADMISGVGEAWKV